MFSLISAVSDCVSIFAFAPLVGVPVVIGTSLLDLNICSVFAEIKKYGSTIKKEKKEKA